MTRIRWIELLNCVSVLLVFGIIFFRTLTVRIRREYIYYTSCDFLMRILSMDIIWRCVKFYGDKICEIVSKINAYNNWWEEIEVIQANLDDSSYFEGKDELKDYIYNR